MEWSTEPPAVIYLCISAGPMSKYDQLDGIRLPGRKIALHLEYSSYYYGLQDWSLLMDLRECGYIILDDLD